MTRKGFSEKLEDIKFIADYTRLFPDTTATEIAYDFGVDREKAISLVEKIHGKESESAK
jgi:hypothetical protein